MKNNQEFATSYQSSLIYPKNFLKIKLHSISEKASPNHFLNTSVFRDLTPSRDCLFPLDSPSCQVVPPQVEQSEHFCNAHLLVLQHTYPIFKPNPGLGWLSYLCHSYSQNKSTTKARGAMQKYNVSSSPDSLL